MTTRRLVVTWALLMGLILVVGLAGGALETHGGSAPWLAVLGGATVFKARLILARYLRLAEMPAALSGFVASVFAVVALVAVSVALVRTPIWKPVAPRAAAVDVAPSLALGDRRG